MIKKLNINEGYEDFDENELYFYIQDCIGDAFEKLEDNELNVQTVKDEVPGYDVDWCADNASMEYVEKRNQLIDELTNLYVDSLLAFRKDTTNESLTEAMRVTNSKTYQTEFGPFVIETQEGKARRRNWSTGKMEWKEVRSTNGFFKDYPDAVEFFVTNDYGDKYVSSSQGNYSGAWEDFLEADDYGKAIELVNDEVVRCFQDYYGDTSIN